VPLKFVFRTLVVYGHLMVMFL